MHGSEKHSWSLPEPLWLQTELAAQKLPVTGINLVSTSTVQPSSAGTQACALGSVAGTCISAPPA